jgi:hypothetical protein
MVLNFFDAILIVWLITVSIIIYKISNHYKKLTKNTTGENLEAILEDILKKLNNLEKENEDTKRRLEGLEQDGERHLQKMSIIRFNPFKDTGGNQSFALAILTANGDGMILSNLYARTGSRWYIKKIKAGKGDEMELSKEEEEAIKNALKSQ